MEYDKSTFEETVTRFGEVFFVLDSDREYIIHGIDGYEFIDYDGHTIVRAEGLQDGQFLKVEFPLDAIEHHYSHKEI